MATTALEMTTLDRVSASKLMPDEPPNTKESATILSESTLFMYAVGDCMESIAYSSFSENNEEKRADCVEMEFTVAVPL